MAPIRFNLRETRGGELSGHGVQHSDTVLHAAIRDHEHRLLQMENEQGPRLHDVHPLLRLRRRLADVRVRDSGMPGVGQPGQRSRGSRGIKKFLSEGNVYIHLRNGRTLTGLVIIIVIVVGESRPTRELSSPRSPLRAEEETACQSLYLPRSRARQGDLTVLERQ